MTETAQVPEVVDVVEKRLAKIDGGPQPPALTGYDALIEKAVLNGAGMEQLEKLMELQERHEANEARKAYHRAMAAFKADPPEIYKDASVGYAHKKGDGSTNYKHATLANVAEKINRALSAHGLSASWKTEQSERGITVTCRIVHELGHHEETSLTAGADNSGKKNSIQAIGSTVSYLQRYTILALTGLATKEMDDDGNSAGGDTAYLSNDQLNILTDKIKECGWTEAEFLSQAKVESLECIPAAGFTPWLGWLQKNKKEA